MPRCCIAAGCSTSSGEGHSLHAFPRDESMRKKWIRAIKQQRSNWDGPSSSLLLCSKHFEPECFALEGARYRDTVGIPARSALSRMQSQLYSKDQFTVIAVEQVSLHVDQPRKKGSVNR